MHLSLLDTHLKGLITCHAYYVAVDFIYYADGTVDRGICRIVLVGLAQPGQAQFSDYLYLHLHLFDGTDLFVPAGFLERTVAQHV